MDKEKKDTDVNEPELKGDKVTYNEYIRQYRSKNIEKVRAYNRMRYHLDKARKEEGNKDTI